MNIVKSHYKISIFLKNKNLINKLYKKNIIISKILQIQKKFIIFDGNLKCEHFLKRNEFLNNKEILEVKEGDYVELFLINIENNCNFIEISRKKLKNYIFWKKILIFYIKKKFIKGSFINKIKGGYSISINDFKCFLPFSCSDKKISNFSYYIGKKLYFLIFKVDFIKKNIILSRKIIINRVINIKRKIFFKNIKVGSLLKGIIKSINNYCIFIDIGYLDCISYYKDIFWGNYKYANEFLKIGQSLMALVLKIDKKNYRVFLGIKQIFNFWKYISKFKNSLKYIRILKLNNNSIYVVLCKNLMASIGNFLGKKTKKYLNINNYKRIKIKNFNYKKKRLTFNFNPPLAQQDRAVAF
ncbi:SSU ribosomal protein S1p [Candidatus Nasuia deltocephalinicola]|uniref:SSU ribosomal protein S1p n=1 Tax=Candidatus Nasuia deltocephalincola TaxID=1160784 RepID=A0A0S2UP44_9PROT|nr:SSU ribosomal protein S1p [Candidatus Nasuia deltocephalinicola]